MDRNHSAFEKGSSYYAKTLAAERLKRVYDLAPLQVRRYLSAEIAYVQERMPPGCRVLELGCGYGRVLKELSPRAGVRAGIDTSFESLRMAKAYLATCDDVMLVLMDAAYLAFPRETFDLVCCLQNGISAFHVDQRQLMAAAVGVTRTGGQVLFSSYAEAFWEDRLDWFRLQAHHGLLGDIDETATGRGVIVCKDGFQATTVTPDQFRKLSQGLGKSVTVNTVAASSVFCEIRV